MRKEDYNAWRNMPLTQEIFKLVNLRQEKQNIEFLTGSLMRPTNDETMQNYYLIIGYNKALDDIKNMEYEDLVEIPLETQENENEANEEGEKG